MYRDFGMPHTVLDNGYVGKYTLTALLNIKDLWQDAPVIGLLQARNKPAQEETIRGTYGYS
jgi:hypothetical protein